MPCGQEQVKGESDLHGSANTLATVQCRNGQRGARMGAEDHEGPWGCSQSMNSGKMMNVHSPGQSRTTAVEIKGSRRKSLSGGQINRPGDWVKMNQKKDWGHAAGVPEAGEIENGSAGQREPSYSRWPQTCSGTSLDRSTAGGRGEKLKCWVLSRQRRGKGMQESDKTMGKMMNH